MRPFTFLPVGMLLWIGVMLAGCAGHFGVPARVAAAAPVVSPEMRPIGKADAIRIAADFAIKKYPWMDFSREAATAEPSDQVAGGWRVRLGGPRKEPAPGHRLGRSGFYTVIVIVCADGSVSSLGGLLGGW